MATTQKKTPESLTLSVVIGVYNRPRIASQLAASIHRVAPETETIIVEQGKQYTDPHSSHYRYVYMKTPGLPEARNRGLQEATGDIVLYLDDDVEITPDTIAAHRDAYRDTSVVGVAGRVITDGDVIPADANVPAGKTNVLATVFVKDFWSTKRQEVDYAYGCHMSFRRKTLLAAGGFDNDFDYFDEIDAALRMKQYGTILFEPAALVYHHKAPSGGTREHLAGKKAEVYRCYGSYIAKRVPFPLSLISMLLRTRTAYREKPRVVRPLWQGYKNKLI